LFAADAVDRLSTSLIEKKAVPLWAKEVHYQPCSRRDE